MKKVLVTGGAGFIGTNLILRMLNSGYSVSVLDDFSSGTRDYLEGLDVKIYQGSILDKKILPEALNDVQSIVHLAAQTGVPKSLLDPELDFEVNVRGTLNLLEESRSSGIEKFVFASSNAPLGRQKQPSSEDKAPLPISPYGASKLACEGYCLAYHGSWGLKTVVLRFGNLYGPYSAHKESVVAKFYKDIIQYGSIIIEGDGSQTRDFLYVGDLTSAVLNSLNQSVEGEVFQIATGVETSIVELAKMITEIVEADVSVEYGTPRTGDIQNNYSKILKAKKILNWWPQTELHEGLSLTWNWMKLNTELITGNLGSR